MTARYAWRNRRADPAPPPPRVPTRVRAAQLRQAAAYWLLYVVALAAAVLHWRAGNEFLSAACAAMTILSAAAIAATHRRP
ncbi:hypothetical protein LG943_20600 [Streptomonospora sp. S1-112]|uniref:Uncharacterized protein n=1 Tax=Streptomonospora mangrovi TaxID=2883123 RepID=A0A9X3NYG0_9ACTN|nr:hypothetical protein [Streptomonospora mangrovi]MDA0566691.1 hypothetical protein [Streptomonospora mangrovi]